MSSFLTKQQRDAVARSTLVGLGVGVFGATVASQLDVKLDSSTMNSIPTEPPVAKPVIVGQPSVFEVTPQVKYTEEVDIVIVGSGAAGLMAGVSFCWSFASAIFTYSTFAAFCKLSADTGAAHPLYLTTNAISG